MNDLYFFVYSDAQYFSITTFLENIKQVLMHFYLISCIFETDKEQKLYSSLSFI